MKKHGIATIGLLSLLMLTACGGGSSSEPSDDNSQSSNDDSPQTSVDDKFLGYNPLPISADSLTGTWVAIGNASQIKKQQKLDDYYSGDEASQADYELSVNEEIKTYFIIRPTDSGELEYSECITGGSNFVLLDINNESINLPQNDNYTYGYSVSGKITEKNIIVANAHSDYANYDSASVRQFEMIKISNDYDSFGEFEISSPGEDTETFDVTCMQKIVTELTDNYGNKNTSVSFEFTDLDRNWPLRGWVYMLESSWDMVSTRHLEASGFFDQNELNPSQTDNYASDEKFQFMIDEETDFSTQITFDGEVLDHREEYGSTLILNFNGSIRIDLPTQ